MPTIFSHAVVPVAISLGIGKKVSRRLMLWSAVCSILPDVDTLAFKLGIPYASQWGHRGFTHSIVFAMLVALIAIAFSRKLKSPPYMVWLMVFVAVMSHSLLDMCTDGGLGVALYWPFSLERHFFYFRPIEVSPIGARFFSQRGLDVIKSELLWVVLPALILMFTLRGMRRK